MARPVHPLLGPQLDTEPYLARRLRAHQSWFRTSVLRISEHGTGRAPYRRPLGSILPESASAAGRNFTSAAAEELFLRRHAEGWGLDPIRCRAFMTSSQALALNLFGPLFAEQEWLLATLRTTLSRDDLTAIETCELEYAARFKSDALGDSTRVDAMITLSTATGRLYLAVEVKYGDRFNSRKVAIERNLRYLKLGDLWHDPTATLPDRRLNQLTRCHALAEWSARNTERPAESALLLLHFPGDAEAIELAQRYTSVLRSPQQFTAVPIDVFLSQMESSTATEHNQATLTTNRARYVDLGGSETVWNEYIHSSPRRGKAVLGQR